MAIEEEIARVIDKAFDDWQGEESEAAFVTARLAPLLNRVRAEALREAATAQEEASMDPRDTPLPHEDGWRFITVGDWLRSRADRIEQNSEGSET